MKLKDKKIEILQSTNTKDPEGFNTQTLTPIAPPLWAYFRQLSGKEIYSGGAAVTTEQVLFTVNYRADVDTRHFVRYKGKLYDIARVDAFEGYKDDITLYCKLSGGETQPL